MKLYYHNIENDKELQDSLDLEFISNRARFSIWFENDEAGWYYVHEGVLEDEKTMDDICGNFDKELLELMYNKIGKILKNRTYYEFI